MFIVLAFSQCLRSQSERPLIEVADEVGWVGFTALLADQLDAPCPRGPTRHPALWLSTHPGTRIQGFDMHRPRPLSPPANARQPTPRQPAPATATLPALSLLTFSLLTFSLLTFSLLTCP